MKEKKNIHGFKAPDGYFENLEESLINTMATERFPKETGFTIPDGYFDKLETAVIGRIHHAEEGPKVITLFNRKRVLGFAAVAACIAVVITIFSRPEVASFESLQEATIVNYLEANSDLNSSDLIAMMDDETITTLTLETELTSEENIEDYLMDALDNNTLLIE